MLSSIAKEMGKRSGAEKLITSTSFTEVFADLSRAIELAPRVWWVGSILPRDKFQCHVYLIKQGDQSVVIDPVSALITDKVITKIDSIIGPGVLVDHVEVHADHEGVVVVEAAREGLSQLRDLRTKTTLREFGQYHRITLTRNEGAQHGSPGHPRGRSPPRRA